jgi:hypothetical protein
VVVGVLAASLIFAHQANAQAQSQQPAPAYFPADLPGTPYTPPIRYQEQPAPYTLPPVEPIRLPEHISNDPLLDRPFAPQPGFYFYSEAYVTGVHLTNQLSGTVTTPGGRVDGVAPQGSPLDMSVEPRFELGYRIPNGFGEIGLGFRWLTTSGGGNTIDAFGPAAQHGRFNFNVFDLDYHTREFSLGLFPGDQWDFRWTFGFRGLNLYFDNRLDFATPGPGAEAVVSQRDTNSLNAYGVHVALDLHRKLDCWVPGLAFGGRVGWTDLFGRVRQHFFEGLADGAGVATGFGRFETSPLAFEGQIGLSYTVPNWNHAFFFVGYETQYWWQIGRLSNVLAPVPNVGSAVNSRATLELQGFVIRAELNF